MSNILKGLNEGAFNRDEEHQQNAMDTRRSSDLSRERNAGLDEPDELPSRQPETRNGVYEYNVPAGQEQIAKELGLQLHMGHWFSRIPFQRADFQFGRPQFHEIPAKNVEEQFDGNWDEKINRLKKQAQQGERKTVWDPVKRVYKTVPVKQSAIGQGVEEGSGFDKWADERAASQLHKLKKPHPETWHDVDPKLGKQVDKMSQAEKVKKGFAHSNTLKKKGVAEGSLNEFAPDGFNGGDDGDDLQLYLNIAKKLNMKKYKPSTAHALIAKKMAELVDVVDDDKVDYARHVARKAQGLPSMLDQQGVAEGLSDTQQKIQNTINKLEDRLKHAKTPEQWDNIKNRIERLQAGLKRSKQGVAEGSEKHECPHCLGSGRMVRDPDIGTDQECFVCDGTGYVDDEQGVAEGSLNEGQYEMMMRNGQVKKFVAKDDADAKRIAAGHGAKSVIKLRGGVPAGKVSEQGVAEMDKSQPSHGRDGKISHSTYGSRDKGGSTGQERTAKMTTADRMMKDAHKVMMKSMSNAEKADKGWRNPNIDEQGVAEGSFDNASPMTKDTVKSDRIRSLKNLIAIAKEKGRQLRVQELELELKKLQGVAEGSIKDAEHALARHGQYKVDYEKKYGPMSGADLHQHEVMRKQLLDKKRRAQTAYAKKQGVAEGQSKSLSIQQLATVSDEALDNAYHYGRSTPGNNFGWQANLMSAAYAKKMIDAGVTDIEKISDAIHKGWNVTAQKFVQDPSQFDDSAKLQAAGKLEAKVQQRAQLMKQNYAQLPDEEKEKDRVVARALLQAITGQQGVAEGVNDYLWHGSKSEHEILYPQQANDTGGKEESNKNAVYATPSAKIAIAMGLTTPGSDTGMFPNDPQMVLFSGNIRKGQMVYLHKVPKDLFIKHNSREWYSKPGVQAIKPIEVVKVPVDQWLHLIRQATPQDLELRKKYMKQGVAEGFGDKIKGAAKSVKRAAQGWGVGGAPDMVTPAGAVKAFKNMDGQRLANFVASRKELSTPRKGSARAFADKVIDREMKQRGYGRVVDKDEQGVAEDDAHDVEQRMITKIAKYKEYLANLKKTDPEAYKREMEKNAKAQARMPAVSTFEDSDPCWDNYKQIGMKEKDGKKVPNCVPVKETKSNILKGLMK